MDATLNSVGLRFKSVIWRHLPIRKKLMKNVNSKQVLIMLSIVAFSAVLTGVQGASGDLNTASTIDCLTITGCKHCNKINNNQCDICDGSNFFIPDGSGGCMCNRGHYYNQVTGTCQACSRGCIYCGSSGCLSCDSANYFVSDGNGGCVCMTGYTLSGTKCVSAGCINFPNCLECITTACTKCTSQYYLDSSSKCQLCSLAITGCSECVAPTICLLCDAKEHFVQNGAACKCDASNHYVSGGQGNCVCDSTGGYYTEIDGTCHLCSDVINGCATCDSATNCLACQDSNNFILDSNTHTCKCKSGYY